MSEIKTAIMCIAKMENLYIRDFVEYYHRLGFTHIFIYDNNDVNGEQFTDVIADYIHDGYVTILNVRGVRGTFYIDDNMYQLQESAYTHCYYQLCNDYDWVMAVDIDEFLTFTDENMTIDKYLLKNEFQKCDVIYVNWLNYGDSGKIYREPNIPVYERLTQPIAADNRTWENAMSILGCNQYEYDNQTIKSIVRTRKQIKYINSHIVQSMTDDELCAMNTAGIILPQSAIIEYGVLQLDYCDFSCAYLRHYVTKTIQEWMESKMQRGFPDAYNNCYYTKYPTSFFRHGNEWTIEKQEFIDKFMYENYVKKDGTKN